MRFIFSVMLCLYFIISFSTSYAQACNSKTKLGVSRTLTVNTKGGALYGTVQYKNTLNLKPREVILTFDDGPHPKNTISILKTLKDHCTKATFFAVGRMIQTYPKVLKRVADEGHTVAAHTHTHPNMQRLSLKKAKYEIERSIAEAIRATGKPIAPFFRFPGLGHTKKLNKYLASRDIATLSVDVISNDSFTNSPKKVIRNVMSALKRKKRGMILMHDLKRVTARALPGLLYQLKKHGYKIVHIVPQKSISKSKYKLKPLATASLQKKRKNKDKTDTKNPLVTRTDTVTPNIVRAKYDPITKIKNATVNKAPAACLFLLFACVR